MSSPRLSVSAFGRRTRLGLVELEHRAVPATFTLGIDPAADPQGAVAELVGAFGELANFDEPNTITLFPGGVYVFDNSTTSGQLALGAVNPTSSKTDGGTYLTVVGNGAVLRRAATSAGPGGVQVPTRAFSFLALNGDAKGFGRAQFTDLTFDNGETTGSGGAVAVNSVPVTFSRVRFTSNSATGNGGAVVFASTAVGTWQNRFDFCTFDANTAGGSGGAVALSDGSGSFEVANSYTHVFTQTNLTNNTAGADGGAIAARDDDFFITGSALANNAAGNRGGGLFVNSDRFTGTSTGALGNTLGYLSNTTVDSNTAKSGGGLYVDGGWTDVRVYSSTITFNTASSEDAGGIQWANDLASPAGRPNNTYVRVEVAFSVVAQNTSGDASAPDLQGLFWDPTTPTRDNTAVQTAIGYGTNFIGNPGGITGKSDVDRSRTGDPVLGPLQDSGGGLLTRLPQPGSPLIDAGRSTLFADLQSSPGVASSSDERGSGYARIAFGVRSKRIDIGAAEVQPAGSIALLAVQGDRQSTAARASFATPLVLRTVDRFGAPLPGQQVTALPIPAGAGAEFPLGNTGTTDAAGQITLYPVANKTVGTYQQLVQVGQTTVSFNLTNRQRLNFIEQPTDAAGVDLSGNNQSAAVASTFGSPLKVLVSRFDGSPIPNAAVTFLARPGANGQFVTLAAPGATVEAGGLFVTVPTDANGFATVTATANTKSGTLNVLASVNGVDTANGAPTASAAITFTLTNVAGAPVQLGFLTNDPTGVDQSGNEQQALVPNRFVAPLRVLASDQFGNFSADVPVTFTSVADPATGALALLSAVGGTPTEPAVTVQTVNGVAAATAVAGSKAGTYAVTATSPGLAPVSFRLTNLPGLPASLTPVGGGNQSAVVVSTAVSSGTAGAFGAPLVVEARDAGGNPVPNATVTFQAAGVGAGARAEPVTAVTGPDGRASVVVVPNSVSGTYTVVAQVQSGDATFATANFTLTNLPGQPAAVTIFSGGGQSAQVNSGFASPLVVRVLDQFQNPVPGVTPVVTANGVTFQASPTGADGLSTVTAAAGASVGNVTVTARVNDLSDTDTLTVVAGPAGTPLPQVGVPVLTAVGLDAGIASRVTVYNPDGTVRVQFAPFDPGFLGGTRTAIARTPTGTTVVAVPGPGRFPDARVFNADDGTELASFQPFEQTFTGGVFVASADVDRDGWDDYVFSPDQGGGPRVQIRSGRTGGVLQDFFGIDDPAFRGGARTALGDLTGDGVPELIVSAGFTGGPRIAVYEGTSLTGFRAVPRKLVGDFFAFEQTLRNGAYLAAGDVTGDGAADVVLAGGPGGGPRVRVLDGSALAQGRQQGVTDFFAGPSTDRGGIKVTVRNLDGDAKNDIVTASGTGDGSRVSFYLGRDLRAGQSLATRGFDDLAGFDGGVFVG